MRNILKQKFGDGKSKYYSKSEIKNKTAKLKSFTHEINRANISHQDDENNYSQKM